MGVWRHQRTIDRLEADLVEVRKLCTDTAHEQKKLDLEFTELYDKTSRLMKRMARRYAHDQKESSEGMAEEQAPSHLDSLDPISRSIMLRRAGGAMQK